MVKFNWRLNSRPNILAVTLAMVVLADFLFYGEPAGWTFALFEWVLLATFLMRRGERFRRGPARVFIVLLAALGLSFVLEPGPLALAMVALGLLSLPALAQLGWSPRAANWIDRLLRSSLAGWATVWRDRRLFGRWDRRHGGGPLRLFGFLLGWMIPIALSAVFVFAFRFANPIIERWISNAANWLRAISAEFFGEFTPWRPAFWFVVFTWVWALLRLRISDRLRRWWPGRSRVPRLAGRTELLDSSLIVRCLVAFNAVFLVQMSLDLYYLWGGAALPPGMTYAEYAHRGAYTLVLTALLAALFVLATFRPGGGVQNLLLARRLVYLWLAQNVFLIVSSFWRLHLYVDVYALTRLRVAAGLWMLLVALGLPFITWRIVARRSNDWLVGANALACASLLYICCFADIRGAVARYNVTHCKEMKGDGPPIDIDYLVELGPASLPSLALLPSPLPTDKPPSLTPEIARDRLLLKLGDQTRNWRAWTWRRSRLLNLSIARNN